MKHAVYVIAFVLVWALTGSGLESAGVESGKVYMVSGGLLGVAGMAILGLWND